MTTFWILVLFYCFLFPVLYLWWERRKMQKDIPYIIHESLKGLGTDTERIFEALSNIRNWQETRNRYYQLYGEDLTHELMDEFNVEELQKAESILLKTKRIGN